jgi:hypothetical protein
MSTLVVSLGENNIGLPGTIFLPGEFQGHNT